MFISDDQKVLNVFEGIWQSTHRAKHLLQVKRSDARKKGGFLDEWPEDEMSGEVSKFIKTIFYARTHDIDHLYLTIGFESLVFAVSFT